MNQHPTRICPLLETAGTTCLLNILSMPRDIVSVDITCLDKKPKKQKQEVNDKTEIQGYRISGK